METKKFHYNPDGVITDFRPFYDDDADVESPYVALTFDEWQDLSAIGEGERRVYRDGKAFIENDPDYVHVKSTDELISDLNRWFDAYDMQVKQYERDVRLNITPDIHIGEVTYASISELDLEAQAKAAELKNLRLRINENAY